MTRKQPLLVVSGSCSAVTARQIDRALTASWVGIDAFCETAAADVVKALQGGKNAILHTSIGPDDRRRANDLPEMGTRMGKMTSEILANVPTLQRLVFAGGDTSSHALAQLGVTTFRMITRISPGAPLCEANGLEIVCKGGQAGPEDFFLLAAGET